MIIDLEEMKSYLRVDFEDDDKAIQDLITSSQIMCMSIARIDEEEEFVKEPNAKIAVMYAVAFQYEHREDCDYHALELSLRALLSGIRKAGF